MCFPKENNVVSGLSFLFISRPVTLRGGWDPQTKLASQQTVLSSISTPFERLKDAAENFKSVRGSTSVGILESIKILFRQTKLSMYVPWWEYGDNQRHIVNWSLLFVCCVLLSGKPLEVLAIVLGSPVKWASKLFKSIFNSSSSSSSSSSSWYLEVVVVVVVVAAAAAVVVAVGI